MTNTIFFHEDSYGQIEFMPEKNFFNVQKYIENLTTQDNSLLGFQKITERDKPLLKLEDLKIPTEEIHSLLSQNSINYFPIVNTGFGNKSIIKESTVAFGFERLGVFVESNNSIVNNLWIGLSSKFQSSKSCINLLKTLQLLGEKYQLILIDWDEKVIIRLQNLNDVKQYLADVFGFNF